LIALKKFVAKSHPSQLLHKWIIITQTGRFHSNQLASVSGFHDCVGGCNGCLNFNNYDNAGLEVAVDSFTSLYYAKGYNNIVSLADFFALGTVVSIINAVSVSNMERTGNPKQP